MGFIRTIQQTIGTQLRHWKYEIVGPTTAHLRFECYLLASLLILTVASLRGLYKESFGTKGDVYYLCLTALVAARHLLFRLYSTWDPSTHASPSLTGLFSHFLQSHCCGGQTFDRPWSLQQQWLHQHIFGSSSSSSSVNSSVVPIAAADRLVQITSSSDAKMTNVISNAVVSWGDVLPGTMVYAWHIFCVDFWFPIRRFFSSNDRLSLYMEEDDEEEDESNRSTRKKRSGGSRSSSSTAPKSNFRVFLESLEQQAWHIWTAYGPSLQFCLTLGVFLYYKWYIYEFRTGHTPMSLFYSAESATYQETTILSVSTQNAQALKQAAGKNGDRSAGVYDQLRKPTEGDIIFVMMSFGTLFCLFVFSRVITPLPDLVAGGHVLKDVRTEARAAALEIGGSSSTGGSGKKGSRNRDWFWLLTALRSALFSFLDTSPSSGTMTSEAAPWTERQRSIVSENRLHMSIAVIIVRVVENALLFGVLPRTHFACRATGHCPAGPPVWELSRILYPGAFNKVKRQDEGGGFFLFMERDPLSMIWSFVGVVIISGLLLAAQTVILNRSYLSSLSYISGEWLLIDDRKKNKLSTATLAQLSSTGSVPTIWDPKKKYKKGELVCYPHLSDSIYQATSNSPEGRPRDLEFHGLNAMLRNELGHPSTSSFVSYLATLQFTVILVHAVLWFLRFIFGYSGNTYGLFWAILAHLVAAQGLVSVSRPSSNTMNELRQLSAEVMAD